MTEQMHEETSGAEDVSAFSNCAIRLPARVNRDAIYRAQQAEAERDALRKQVRALTAWRPMETAPKDGTVILVVPESGRLQTAAWLESYGLFMNRDYAIWNPIGWLPLPAPPTEDRS